MNYRKYQSTRLWLHFLTAPLIWLPLPFVLALDLVTTIYHFVCFPIYKINYVKRSDYILVMDRNKLTYLNGLEKLACMYCGYTNGVLRYMKEIAGRTEKYWCGVMHEGRPGFKTQEDQKTQNFSPFGDQEDFEKKYGKIQ